MILRRGLLLSALVWAAACSLCSAAEPADAGDLPVLQVPRTAQAPVVDGALNEGAWAKAAVIDGLKPHRGGKTADAIAKRPTTVRVLWDEQYLYVAFECRDDDIYVTGTLGQDDNTYTEDVAEVFIDPVGDGRQYIETQVNPLNQTLDLMMLSTAEVKSEPSGVLNPAMRATDWWCFREWDWPDLKHAAGRLIEDGKVVGWTAEFAFPAKTLLRRRGMKEFAPMTLRANFLRYDWIAQEGQEKRDLLPMNWSPVVHGCPHISPAAMGVVELVGEAEKGE